MDDIKDILCNGGKLSEVINGYSERIGQIKMAELLNDIYNKNGVCLINAPTGNGKSIGCLVPAIINKGKGRTIISTATKGLQTQYKNKDLPLLHKILNFKSFVFKGKNNYLCLHKFYDSNIPNSYKGIINDWLVDNNNGDLETINCNIPPKILQEIQCEDCDKKKCQYSESCFYYKNKEVMLDSDIVIVNHDLLSLYLTLKYKTGVSILGSDINAIIIDEAHKFENIYTKYSGYSLTFKYVESFVNKLLSFIEKSELSKDEISAFRSGCKSFINGFDSLFNTLYLSKKPNIGKLLLKIGTVQTISKLYSFVHIFEVGILKCDHDEDAQKHIIKRLNKIKDFLSMLVDYESNIDEYCYYIDGNTVKISLIDVSCELNKSLFSSCFNENKLFGGINLVCLMSATLSVGSDFSFVKDRLGIWSETNIDYKKHIYELCVSEIFDYKHSCLLYVPKGVVEPSFDNLRTVFTNQITDVIFDVSNVVDGGIISLFTSYSEMDNVYSNISDIGINRNIITQTNGNVSSNIENMKSNKDSILFGTKTYWEGIDVQGEACSCVIIDRIPFPVFTEPIIEARIEKLKRERKDWFNGYYLPLAIIELQQGFGRLIRTVNDLGMVVILDNRIFTKPYGRKILRALPNCLRTRNFDKVKVFWDIVKKKRKIRGNG